ncbi:MAG: DNA (cytosine-5-)-methyltransferase [Treponema sp.]|nr:DNA (cytosine-5-)-methyltransferase [Treponema sp.]
MKDKSFKFIDLFAGIGGFHLAMKKLGGKCVFASEIKPELRELYKKNFGMECAGDINKVNIEKDIAIYNPQVLCAGFPCQPFSKAGKQQGFDDKERGNLFYKIMEILQKCKPEYVILENVPNLKSHDEGNTYKVISKQLKTLYDIKDEVISPHYFGIPQHRTRIYIVGRLKEHGGLKNFSFPEYKKNKKCNITSIIDENDTDYMTLKPQTRVHMKVWQDFLDLLTEHGVPIPSFPIWAMEWGADYEYEGIAPFYQYKKSLEGKKGKFGCLVQGNSKTDFLDCLPIYAQTKKTEQNHNFPDWKKNFIKWNREFYKAHKEILDPWLEALKQPGFENSHQKFEWNCGNDKTVKPTLYDKIVQFRPSGVRVKLPTYSPALVLTTTQIPIFPWVKTQNGEIGRYMTSREAARLQCMEELEPPDTMAEAFRAFGNAVNVEVVRLIMEKLLEIK